MSESKSTNVEVQAIRKQFNGLQTMFAKYLPKIDPDLIYDLLLRMHENPDVIPTYTLEVFTRAGVDPRVIVSYILEKTGVMPTVYDDNTHYVLNKKLTLEILLQISDLRDVIDVTGAPTTSGCWIADSIKREDI
jgi:hypothetical protein